MDERKNERRGEAQYAESIDAVRRRGLERFGLMTSWAWYDDPKRLVFTLARYKFVSKMLNGFSSVLEVGCGDGLGTRIVAQATESVTAIDFDPEYIDSALSISTEKYPIKFFVHDILAGPVGGRFKGAYSLDVLEHINPSMETLFLSNLVTSLEDDGVCIIGMPSLESQAYASKFSKMGHVNCKTQDGFYNLMKVFFQNVFMFSMNDEVVHTGYDRMSHYNIALCVGKLTRSHVRPES